MSVIALHSVALERFQSFSRPQTIDFCPRPGLKFVTGRNALEPRLGANGTGKSTLFEAIAWCLFGVTSDGGRAAEVVTWQQKTPIVTTRLCIDQRPYTVTRYGMPNRLFVDDQEVEQVVVDQLVGLNRVRFLQTVLFGQGAPLFYDLSSADRAALLDDVFNISFWLGRSEHAARLAQIAAQTLYELDKALAEIAGSLKAYDQQLIASLQARSIDWRRTRQLRLDEAIKEVRQLEQRIADRQQQLQAMTAPDITQTHDLHSIDQAIQDVIVKLRLEEQEAVKDQRLRRFYQHTTVCPTCQRELPAAMRAMHLEELAKTEEVRQQKLSKYQTEHAHLQADRQRLVTENDRIAGETRAFYADQGMARAEIHSYTTQIDRIERRLEVDAQTEDPFAQQLQSIGQEQARLKRQQTRLTVKRLEQITQIEKLNFWKQAFKRVRLFLIKQVLDRLQIEIAVAAATLGLADWHITLTTETETKSGTIKSGIQIAVTPPHSNGARKRYSGGEQQRIKLAVSLGLANLIQRMAGVNFAFEIWDEPTAGLSDEGIGDLLESLTHRAQALDKAIYLLDHRSLYQMAFDETIMVIKGKDGSCIAT